MRSSPIKFFCSLFLSVIFGTSCFAAYPPLKASTASSLSNAWYYILYPLNFVLPHPAAQRNIYEVQTQYNHIRVYESDTGLRYLVFLPENGYQSVFDTKKPDTLVSDYAKYTFLALAALGQTPRKVLFVGMGGAIMPSYFRKHYPEAGIDIVELDADIPSIAHEFFGFNPDNKTQILIEDGRKYIDETNVKYDIIFLDVYDAETIPAQFTTQEFFHNVRKDLNKDGVLSINLANLGDEFVYHILSAILLEFPDTYIFLTDRKTNFITISTMDSKLTFSDIENHASKLDSTGTFNINFSEMLSNRVIYKNIFNGTL